MCRVGFEIPTAETENVTRSMGMLGDYAISTRNPASGVWILSVWIFAACRAEFRQPEQTIPSLASSGPLGLEEKSRLQLRAT